MLRSAAIAALLLTMTACSSDPARDGSAAGDPTTAGETTTAPAPDGEVIPLAKAGGWANTGSSLPRSTFAILAIAYEPDTARQAWEDNVPNDLPVLDGPPTEPGLYGTLEDIDFDRQAMVVWSSGQSGSCPGWLQDVRTLASGAVEVFRGEASQGDSAEQTSPPAFTVCTSDYQPYRMVLAVDRDRLPQPPDLPVPLEGVPDGQAVTYAP